MALFFLYLSLALVLVWTYRLARAKARQPWLWTAAALAITVLGHEKLLGDPWQLFSLAPMIVLLFLKAPTPKTVPPPEGVSCPRCQANHPYGRYYCTNCGWELTKAYSEAGAVPEEPAQPRPITETLEPAAATNAPQAVDVPSQSAQTESPVDSEVPSAPEEDPGKEVAPAMEAQSAKPQTSEPQSAEAATPYQPAGLKPMTGGMPTAARMTERGLGLFDQGKPQEAIDQFTKAMALQADYGPALEGRAEAYAKLGRNEEAAEDRRRLEAINAT
ncbi:MAG: hypothetical protein J4O03_04225 [Chloroflexi bacterium]|nr:hypothetical protein [Chloroflexota bacterium]MCH8348882.1 hypothetical protein [Chloroflexota bacterium]MCI0780314.1 hypothetical protein [Chloroflexota bacterium]MCI0785070.1 hypothetical protein [Chloroflexota bacterium]MCI0792653.1 hypothetical protein [Chloroflexota bacterium]